MNKVERETANVVCVFVHVSEEVQVSLMGRPRVGGVCGCGQGRLLPVPKVNFLLVVRDESRWGRRRGG